MSNLVSTAGKGKPGYCKLCAFAHEPELNERLKLGWNSRQINEWLAKFEVSADRGTIRRHKLYHISSPQDRLVNHANKARRKGELIKNSTPQEFLQAVQDLALQKITDDPSAVTVDHGLKAAQVQMQARQGPKDVQIILAQVFTGNAPELVEGEWKELEG